MEGRSLFFRALVMLMLYLGLRYFGGSASQLLFPIIWLVAFLHELGHALAALLTGGNVLALVVNGNGSGLTTTQGGSAGLILMGGYLGSALFGNLLFYVGATKRQWSRGALLTLAGLMLFSAIKWHTTATSTLLLLGYAAVLILIASRVRTGVWGQNILMFFGMASVLYVLQDFRVGPSSDLAAYEQYVGILPAEAWMYVWLLLVALLTWWNVRQIFARPSAFQDAPVRAGARRARSSWW
jgi:hypothetical protein